MMWGKVKYCGVQFSTVQYSKVKYKHKLIPVPTAMSSKDSDDGATNSHNKNQQDALLAFNLFQ